MRLCGSFYSGSSAQIEQAITRVIIAKGVKSYGLSQKPIGLLILKLTGLLGFGTCTLVSQNHLFCGRPNRPSQDRCSLPKLSKPAANLTFFVKIEVLPAPNQIFEFRGKSQHYWRLSRL